MKQFGSFGEFAAYLATREAATAVALNAGLHRSAELIERTAKEEIGEYQPARDPFPAWEPLAESTVDGRVRQGYSPDEPLLRDGTLRESIHHEVDGLEAVVGSESSIALWQELGTATIPPRSFLGTAAARNANRIGSLLGAAAVTAIAGGERVAEASGYEFTT